MNRGKFLKSLLGIAIAPKVLAEVTPVAEVATEAATEWIPQVGFTQGNMMRRFVSSIDFLDQREINPNIISRMPDDLIDFVAKQNEIKTNKITNDPFRTI
jgi:hypothetical protein